MDPGGGNDKIQSLGLHANEMTALGVQAICEALILGLGLAKDSKIHRKLRAGSF